MRLKGLKKENISEMIQDFSKIEANQSNNMVNESNLCDTNDGVNPLYAILKYIAGTIDIWEIREFFFDNKDSYLRKISKNNKELYNNLQIMLFYTTIIEPWEIGKEEDLPQFFEDTAYYILDNVDEIELINFICQINEKVIFDGCLSCIEPDLVGEIVIIEYFRRKSTNKRKFKDIIKELTKNNINEFVYFMSNCLYDFSDEYFDKTTDEIGECLKEVNGEISIQVCQLMKDKDIILKLSMTYFLQKIGKVKNFDNHIMFKTELLNMFIEDKPDIIDAISISVDMMYTISILRETQRTEMDKVINPVYLEKVIPYFKEWGFPNEVCDIVQKSSIFVEEKKMIESYIISLIDIFGELMLKNNKRDGYPSDRALEYVVAKAHTNNEKEKKIKDKFIEFVMEAEGLVENGEEINVEGIEI